MQTHRMMANKIQGMWIIQKPSLIGIFFYAMWHDKELIQNLPLIPRYNWQLPSNMKQHLRLLLLSVGGAAVGETEPFWESDERQRLPSPKHTHLPKFYLHVRPFITITSPPKCPLSHGSNTPKRIRETFLQFHLNTGQVEFLKLLYLQLAVVTVIHPFSLGCVKIPKNKIAWTKPGKF